MSLLSLSKDRFYLSVGVEVSVSDPRTVRTSDSVYTQGVHLSCSPVNTLGGFPITDLRLVWILSSCQLGPTSVGNGFYPPVLYSKFVRSVKVIKKFNLYSSIIGRGIENFGLVWDGKSAPKGTGEWF